MRLGWFGHFRKVGPERPTFVFLRTEIGPTDLIWPAWRDIYFRDHTQIHNYVFTLLRSATTGPNITQNRSNSKGSLS